MTWRRPTPAELWTSACGNWRATKDRRRVGHGFDRQYAVTYRAWPLTPASYSACGDRPKGVFGEAASAPTLRALAKKIEKLTARKEPSST